MTARRTKFYRDIENAKWKGVCSGIADYTGIDVSWVRIGVVLFTIFGGFPWTLVAYIVAVVVTDEKPLGLYHDVDEQKFWQEVRRSPRHSSRDVKAKFRDINRRLADVEYYYTSNNKGLSQEIEKLR